ncbi:uncharacterized protein G2W53_041441 [Senna tora]|uniref:Uncharacterized protein n=1 Tax=Senna tora TaxID=362788 RepID=A0A834SDR0_9FABA|nr:uncharacterized protein G2W53_041441 [Senna tora]
MPLAVIVHCLRSPSQSSFTVSASNRSREHHEPEKGFGKPNVGLGKKGFRERAPNENE